MKRAETAAEKETRLAAKLRENLRRRKAQTRAAVDTGPAEAPEVPPPGGPAGLPKSDGQG